MIDIFDRFEKSVLEDRGFWWNKFERDEGVELDYMYQGLWIVNGCLLLVEPIDDTEEL